MQTRKTFGIVKGGALRVDTNGVGGIEVNVKMIGSTWAGPVLTPQECRDLIFKLTGALCAATEEFEREHAEEGMARHLGVRREEIHEP